MQVSLVLSEKKLHERRNHFFCDDKISGFRNWSIKVWISADTGRVSISRFSSDTEGKKQVLQDILFFFVLEIKWLTGSNTLFSSSKTA